MKLKNAAKCIVEETHAQRFGISVGGTVSMPVYRLEYDESGYSFQFQKLADVELEVIGTFRASTAQGEASRSTQMIVPVRWVQSLFEAQGETFTYDSFRCTVADALRLNEFKAAAEQAGLREISDLPANPIQGNTLVVQDSVFIETARELRENIETYTAFQMPFFSVLVGIITLVTFLVCRVR